MATVNEWIVPEYFETLGFFVIQPNKHHVVARHKHDAEEIDLLITRPGLAGVFCAPKEVLWHSENLKDVQRAVVSVRGWHTDHFCPSVLKKNPELFNFTELPVIQEARKILGPGSVVKMLCVSDLTASPELQHETLSMMRQNGVDGVLTFRTMLQELVDHLDTAKNYEKSDLLQILRILKTYDLLKDAQLDLFGGKRVGQNH